MLNITLPSTTSKFLIAGMMAVTLFIARPAQSQEIPDWAAPAQEERTITDHRPVPDAGDETDSPPDFPDAPLDPVGLALLAVAGGALAARRLRHAA